MQDFREGVEVKILHAKHRLSVDNLLANNTFSAGQRPATEERRVSGKRVAQTSGLFYHRPTRAELINAESSLGRTLFGPIPAGHRREFFHDRANVWIWHEGWTEPNRKPRQMTIRYEVRPSGVFKKLSAGSYIALDDNELENFRRAAHAYLYLIKHHLYHLA